MSGTTTFDSVFKAAGITLTGSNLIATAASGTNPGVRVTRQIVKETYAEFTATTLSAGFAIGVSDQSWNNASGTILGGDTHGVAWRQDGTVKYNNTNLSTIASYVQGDKLDVAINPITGLFWGRVNNGNWNNNGANAPGSGTSAGTGGIDYRTSLGSTPIWLSFAAAVSSSQAATARLSSSAWLDTAPSGFASPDDNPGSIGEGIAVASTPAVGPARKDPIDFTLIQNGSLFRRGYAGGNTHISGSVQENGAAVANKIIRLYDAASGDFLGMTTSAGDGTYSIPAFGRAAVFAVFFDPTSFEAIAFDRLTPG